MRHALAQIREQQILIGQMLLRELDPLTLKAQQASLAGLLDDLGRYERLARGVRAVALPIEVGARFVGVIDARRTSLLRAHRASVRTWGLEAIRGAEQQLSLSLLGAETTDRAIARVADAVAGEWWRAERIVRTETAWAFSASTADGIEALADEMPDLWQRWSEHVDDATGAPLDDRVAVDSLAMHGQITRPGGLFTMPSAAPDGQPVPDALVGRTWAYPPDRPNGREVLTPWRPNWGIPAWIWDGRRVPATTRTIAR
jgi:hypothetical protein